MKRLTAISDAGEAYYPYCYRADTCDGEGETEKCRDCEFSQQICKTLAAYENTGLTPEEINEYAEKYRKLRERDTAKDVIHVGERKVWYRCPVCEADLSHIKSEFCPFCGQRLKWMEEW